MDLQLTDAVCFVAGSSRGIGKGIARRLLSEGARVALSGRDEAALRNTHQELAEQYGSERVISFPGDLGSNGTAKAAVEYVIERWGVLDCLVANVGSGKSMPGWDIEKTVWDTALDANLWPTIAIVRAALRTMSLRDSGAILIVGSITGMEATAAPLAYSAAKAALANYSANLSRQVSQSNIRVNYLAPGNVLFPGGAWERRRREQPQATEAMLASEVPLNRFGSVDEIADVAAFLVSPRSSFITGATIVADGGQTRSY